MPGFATSHPRATPAPGRAGSDIGRQQRIAGQFEGFTTVWLQGESAPVAADCGLAEAADFGHGARVPVGGARRLGFQNFDNYVFTCSSVSRRDEVHPAVHRLGPQEPRTPLAYRGQRAYRRRKPVRCGHAKAQRLLRFAPARPIQQRLPLLAEQDQRSCRTSPFHRNHKLRRWIVTQPTS